jgi:hypothetical protein
MENNLDYKKMYEDTTVELSLIKKELATKDVEVTLKVKQQLSTERWSYKEYRALIEKGNFIGFFDRWDFNLVHSLLLKYGYESLVGSIKELYQEVLKEEKEKEENE